MQKIVSFIPNNQKKVFVFSLILSGLFFSPFINNAFAEKSEPVNNASSGIILSIPEKALKIGARGIEVENLQKRLSELGFYRGIVDGVFGNGTLSAVFSFQSANSLYTDGVVGNATIAKLNLPNDQIIKMQDVSRSMSRNGFSLVERAKSFLGTPYVWGGRAPGGFDCSGYIYYMLSQFGISSPRMADGQFGIGVPIEKNSLQAGDLVFFSTYEPGPSHVGIYMGDGNFIHASSAAGQVTITPLSKAYYVERYLGARRVVH